MLEPDCQSYRVEEYLWEEQRSPVKRNYFKGQVYALAGGSLEHSLIAVNLVAELRQGSKSGLLALQCRLVS
ncbi:MAG: hypothetical protein WCS37_22025, partial [Chloroflexota bacterium]|nr:hypothetical protein [Chloroflexota bacterium]